MAYEGGVLQGCRAQGGLGRNEGGGGSAIPRYQPSPFILWRVGIVISGMWWRARARARGHGRVAGQEAHIIPPLGLHSLPLKRKVRMVSLRLTGRKIVIDGNHVHPHGAVNEACGGADGTKARLGLARGVRGHDSQKALHRVAGGNEPDGPQPREGHLQLPEKVSGPTFFPKPSRPFGGAHVHMDQLGGGGTTLSPTPPPPPLPGPPCTWPPPMCRREGRGPGSGPGCRRPGRGGRGTRFGAWGSTAGWTWSQKKRK